MPGKVWKRQLCIMINDLNSGSKQRLTSDQTRKKIIISSVTAAFWQKKKSKQNKNIRKNNTQGTENN